MPHKKQFLVSILMIFPTYCNTIRLYSLMGDKEKCLKTIEMVALN